MFCSECGTSFQEGATFCHKCGARLTQPVASPKVLHLVCPRCEGVMNVEKNNPVLFCPFCGAKEMVQENDPVAIERIKNQTLLDLEHAKLQHEDADHRRKSLSSQRRFFWVCLLLGLYITLGFFNTSPREWPVAGLGAALLCISYHLARKIRGK
jgi:Primosomal protein N'' (replication factor Y) - superfamily II helicase